MKIGPQRVHLGERELEGLGWDLNKKPHAHLATRKLQQDPASIKEHGPIVKAAQLSEIRSAFEWVRHAPHARTRRPSDADSMVEDHYRLKRLEMALVATRFLLKSTRICYENMPKTTRLATLRR